MRKEIVEIIFKIAKDNNAFDKLEKYFSKTSRAKLSQNIIECGILPEMFDHDSSEEKLWAKLSDIILSQALTHLGINTKVLGTRGNSADVYGETKEYTIVGDAKTFRLSRTAKNQKDFKVSALDSWREGSNYAILVAPLTQFPNRTSQIYAQAIEKNVTLISYTHLHFLLDFYKGQSLKSIWETGDLLKRALSKSEITSSIHYWTAIDKIVCSTVNHDIDELRKFKLLEIEKTKEIGKEGINFWKNKIKKFNKLSKEDAVKLLIKAEKIETKIRTIEKAINTRIPI